MDISGALNSAVSGMNRASEQVTQASLDIANAPARNQQTQQDVAPAATQAGTETASETSQSVTANNAASNTNTTQSLTELRSGELMFQANGKVFATADSMLGSLIDTRV